MPRGSMRGPAENRASRPWMHRFVCGLALLLGLALALTAITAFTLSLRFRAQMFGSAKQVPCQDVAIVFGAGYWPDGTPSDVMKDRVAAAVELYRQGRVRKLLFSGDNRFVDYNEPGKMREYALSIGMPDADIVLDYAGRRTYDTCYRARDIFGVQSAVLVTQRYHLPRALVTCNALGVPAVGYIADRREYVHIHSYWAREIPALWLAWWELWVSRPTPVLGEPIPIILD